VARYELAQLYDLEAQHVKALLLHARNREEYPRFFRGRYRLAMSLEMIAHPSFQPSNPPSGLSKGDPTDILIESLRVLDRADAIRSPESRCRVYELACMRDQVDRDGDAVSKRPITWPLPRELRRVLLEVAQEELQEVCKQLRLGRVIWAAFQHRDERTIWTHHFRLTERQRFHDGALVADLLVTVRHNPLKEDSDKGAESRVKRHTKRALHIVHAVTGDSTVVKALLPPAPSSRSEEPLPDSPNVGPGGKPPPCLPPLIKRNSMKTRWLPWQARTPSWQAAYNAACLYAAAFERCVGPGNQDIAASLAVVSLRRAMNPEDSEMPRPSEWISVDPDFKRLRSSSAEFQEFLEGQMKKDYPLLASARDWKHQPNIAADGRRRSQGAAESQGSPLDSHPATEIGTKGVPNS
jgi:hypothetical protein